MTDKEKKAVALLQIAQGIKAGKTEIDLETAETLYNLINRQKAEIERLKAENEGYKHLDTILHTAIDKLTANIKSEAIREFGKFLIDKSKNGMVSIADIPDYVKEMMEENENNA